MATKPLNKQLKNISTLKDLRKSLKEALNNIDKFEKKSKKANLLVR